MCTDYEGCIDTDRSGRNKAESYGGARARTHSCSIANVHVSGTYANTNAYSHSDTRSCVYTDHYEDL